ncbi:hypothetical protein TorRG33x02_039820 [Trema orientale]|uniref:Uncharacterized protein n=1 Tax=Trema orientale TaxID=63057 RepID=A0A2P5FR18_TREOI|nr:hypothetical protein TorRG33x02_039820 [Trema orientale]
MRHPSSRRTPSFSSFSSLSSGSSSSLGSSSSSYNPDDSPLGPATPLRSSGVPFSWEHFPGIPKRQQLSRKKQLKESTSMEVLPLPPPTATTNKRVIGLDESAITRVRIKKSATISPKQPFKSDPFFAALVECSKDDDHDHDHDDQESSNANFWNVATAKLSRSLSDRFGLINLYTSCKTTCAVAESIRHLPRSSRSSYDLINSRPR